MTFRQQISSGIALILLIICCAENVFADSWPSHPIRLIVPYPPGGATDQLARVLAVKLSTELQQPVIVENRAGANTAIGTQHVAQAPADGYSILLSSTASMVLNPLLSTNLTYTVERDFTQVSLLAKLPLVLVLSPQVPAANLQEFVNLAKTRPNKLNYASFGIGGPSHLAGELFKKAAGIEMVHVPYNGAAPAMTATMSGTVDAFFDIVSTAMPLVNSGKVKGMAVTTAERLKAYPDIPTIAESGYPGFEASSWFGLALRSGTPKEIITRLNTVTNKILVDPSFRDHFEAIGLVINQPNSPSDASRYVSSDHSKWGEIIKTNRITLAP